MNTYLYSYNDIGNIISFPVVNPPLHGHTPAFQSLLTSSNETDPTQTEREEKEERANFQRCKKQGKS